MNYGREDGENQILFITLAMQVSSNVMVCLKCFWLNPTKKKTYDSLKILLGVSYATKILFPKDIFGKILTKRRPLIYQLLG